MHIQSINNTNLNFNGSYSFKGPWTAKMRDVAEPFLRELAKGDKEIVAKMSTKRALFDRFHDFGQKLYKPTFTFKQEKMSLSQKIKDKLGLLKFPYKDITEHFHSANSITKLLKKRLQIDEFNLKMYRKTFHITNPIN